MSVGRKNKTYAATRLDEIRKELSEINFSLPGSLVMRTTRCQRQGCHCRREPKPQLHGPYPTWTRPVDGRTVTRTLKPEEFEHYQSWFDEARRLKDLVAELEQLSIAVFSEKAN